MQLADVLAEEDGVKSGEAAGTSRGFLRKDAFKVAAQEDALAVRAQEKERRAIQGQERRALSEKREARGQLVG